jgi:LysM repeat protein
MSSKTLPSVLVKLFILAAVLFSSLLVMRPAAAQSTCGESYTVVKGDTLFKISRHCGTTVNALMRANPQIKDRRLIYPKQVLVLPGALLSGSGTTDTYIVQKGDTLRKISTRFNSSVDNLLKLNPDITDANVIHEGQRLAVPKAQIPDTGAGQTYVVQRGDTLRKIATRFGTTVDALLKLNPAITNPDRIYTGQKLVLPDTVSVYVVQRGDTLRVIANKYSTSIDNLMKLNPDIKDANKIFVGQVLRLR